MSQALVEDDLIMKAVGLACRAPSLHNSQPWRWVLEARILQLFSDPTRIGRSTDSTGREVLISCGAALDHLRVVMAAVGWQANIDRFPNPNNLKHLASIAFTPIDFVTDAELARAEAVVIRRSDRLPFAAPPQWDSFDPVLRHTVDAHVAVLDVIPDDSRPQLAVASQLSEQWRRYDSSYHAELRWWTSGLEEFEGIPPSALPSQAEAKELDVSRQFPAREQDQPRADIAPDRSKILVVSTYDDSRRYVLDAGEVLSTLLLECTEAGLATCTLTHMIEVSAARDIVQRLTQRSELPQLLIRVGQAPQGEQPRPPTPRRPLEDVLEIHRQ
ncbi:MAG TPA: NAD(P)H nitroreductase [Mycobacterium sp.]|nr:NAD(P)H nitroreductase [Mycobacterium sp.]